MKKTITGCLIATLLIACNNHKPANSTEIENEKLIRQFYEYFNKHEWEKMAGMYSEVAEFRDPSLGKEVVKQTRQQTIEKYSILNQLFPDIKDEIVQIYPAGNKHVVVEFLSKGNGADGTQFELPICTVFTIENGKIIKDFTYYDNF